MTVEVFEQATEIKLKETENLIEVVESTTELIEVIEGGAQGKPGPAGEQGERGERGERGFTGPTGFAGADGKDHETFTMEMNGTQSNASVEHNLGRIILIARIDTPDGEIAEVSVKNLDNNGEKSLNVVQIKSSVPMLGTLTLI